MRIPDTLFFSGKNGEKLLPEMKCDGTELNIQAVNSGDATGFVKVRKFPHIKLISLVLLITRHTR